MLPCWQHEHGSNRQDNARLSSERPLEGVPVEVLQQLLEAAWPVDVLLLQAAVTKTCYEMPAQLEDMLAHWNALAGSAY